MEALPNLTKPRQGHMRVVPVLLSWHFCHTLLSTASDAGASSATNSSSTRRSEPALRARCQPVTTRIRLAR